MGAGIRVQDPGVEQLLYEYDQRLRNVELNGDDRGIYVGTIGIDGVDALITPDSPPFENGWTNSLGLDAPVSFRRTINAWVHIRGGFTGGADGTTIFRLPPGFRPEYAQPMIIPAGTSHFATVVVNIDGTVVFGTTV